MIVDSKKEDSKKESIPPKSEFKIDSCGIISKPSDAGNRYVETIFESRNLTIKKTILSGYDLSYHDEVFMNEKKSEWVMVIKG